MNNLSVEVNSMGPPLATGTLQVEWSVGPSSLSVVEKLFWILEVVGHDGEGGEGQDEEECQELKINSWEKLVGVVFKIIYYLGLLRVS